MSSDPLFSGRGVKGGKEKFDTWSIAEERLPERSRLHSLSPMHLGTEYVESLTSYLMRLSESHSLRLFPLVKSEILPIANSRYHTNYKDAKIFLGLFGNRVNKVNCKSLCSDRLINVLHELTQQDSVHEMVFSLFGGVVRDTRAWCPQCINEWITDNKIIYEPLIWAFSLIKMCPIHEVRLQESCPSCNKQLKILDAESRLNYCYHCKGMLSKSNDEKVFFTREELRIQKWICRNIFDLIKIYNTRGEPRQDCLKNNLMKVWEGSSLSNTSKMFLITSGDFYGYCHNTNIPFNKLMWICYVLRISVSEFLYKPYTPTNNVRTINFARKKLFGIVEGRKKANDPPARMKLLPEEKCQNILYKTRWPQGIQCSKCGHRKLYTLPLPPKNRVSLYMCDKCKHRMTNTSGTFMKWSHTPLNVWFLAIMLVCTNEQTPFKFLTEIANIPGTTAGNILKKIRAAHRENDPLLVALFEQVQKNM